MHSGVILGIICAKLRSLTLIGWHGPLTRSSGLLSTLVAQGYHPIKRHDVKRAELAETAYK